LVFLLFFSASTQVYATECKEGEEKFLLNNVIEGGKIEKICYHKAKAIYLTTQMDEAGSVEITIPRLLVNPVGSNCEADFFIVFVDGLEKKYTEDNKKESRYFRVITIPLEKGNNIIEILGSSTMEGASNERMCKEKFPISPPIQQIKMGFLRDQIECSAELSLVFKSTDGSPACVKPDTKSKLIERGWAKSS
jgi:hypothetical protein